MLHPRFYRLKGKGGFWHFLIYKDLNKNPVFSVNYGHWGLIIEVAEKHRLCSPKAKRFMQRDKT